MCPRPSPSPSLPCAADGSPTPDIPRTPYRAQAAQAPRAARTEAAGGENPRHEHDHHHDRATATPTSTVITNIAGLVTNDPSLGDGTPIGLIQDAAVVIDGDRIAWVGESSKAPATDNAVDADGRAAVPGFVDSHSHLVFAGDRTEEFNARMSGRGYAAGGIRTTVAATRAATDAELAANVARYLAEALRQGTTTLETKSGYGLTVQHEARAVRIACDHTDEVTYLGAHIVPPEYADDPAAYVALVTGEMLDACAPYARWIDVFCEQGAFDGDQARAILTAAWRGASSPVSTPISSPTAPGCCSPSSSTPPPPTTAPISPTPMWTRWPTATPWRPSFPARSSPPAPSGRTPAVCSTRAPPSRSPPTAIRVRPSPRPCRSVSPSPYATWA